MQIDQAKLMAPLYERQQRARFYSIAVVRLLYASYQEKKDFIHCYENYFYVNDMLLCSDLHHVGLDSYTC